MDSICRGWHRKIGIIMASNCGIKNDVKVIFCIRITGLPAR